MWSRSERHTWKVEPRPAGNGCRSPAAPGLYLLHLSHGGGLFSACREHCVAACPWRCPPCGTLWQWPVLSGITCSGCVLTSSCMLPRVTPLPAGRSDLQHSPGTASSAQPRLQPPECMSAREGLAVLRQQFGSLERYGAGAGAFLAPLYGCGELPQAFCRSVLGAC